MGCGSDVGEEKRDSELMPDCAPSVCGMDGSTVIDEKKAQHLTSERLLW